MVTTAWASLLIVLAPAQGFSPQSQPDSLDLGGWLALARERSPTLAVAAAGIREAEGRGRLTRSGRGPRAEVGALYLRFRDPPSVDFGPLGSYAPILENNFLVQMQVVQPLYTGGRVTAAIRAADWGRRAAESTMSGADVDLSAAIAHAYDDLLLARALGDVARQSVAVLEEAVRVAREYHAAGTVARLDVLRAETRLSTAEAAVRASDVAQAVARERLAALVGIHPDSAPAVAGSLEYVEVSVDLAALSSRARSARPDVRALHALASGREASAAVARASRRPSVSLFAATLLTRPELVTGKERWAWELLGGLSVNWSFLDWGESAGGAEIAEAAAARAEAQAAQLVDAAVAAVRTQGLELSRAVEDVRAGRQNVGRAQRALEIAQVRYADGVGIQLEVFEAEADLTRARADLLRAIHAHRSAAIELRRAVGLAADAAIAAPSSGGE